MDLSRVEQPLWAEYVAVEFIHALTVNDRVLNRRRQARPPSWHRAELMPHLDGWRIDHAGEPPRLERDARPLWERVGRGLEVDADVLVEYIKILAIAAVGEPIPNREHGPPGAE